MKVIEYARLERPPQVGGEDGDGLLRLEPLGRTDPTRGSPNGSMRWSTEARTDPHAVGKTLTYQRFWRSARCVWTTLHELVVLIRAAAGEGCPWRFGLNCPTCRSSGIIGSAVVALTCGVSFVGRGLIGGVAGGR